MTSRVSQLEAPLRFVDEQVRGPFARLRHEHLFVADGEITRMVDRVDFAAPFGVLGALIERAVLRRYLARLIRERAAYIKAAAQRAATAG